MKVINAHILFFDEPRTGERVSLEWESPQEDELEWEDHCKGPHCAGNDNEIDKFY